MSTHPAIGINPDWMSTGSSFEEEMRGLIWHRVRLIFWLGLGASLALFVVDNVAVPYRSFVSPLEPWRTEIWLMHAASYAIALLIVLFGRLKSVPLQMVAMWVTAFNIVLLIAGLAVLEPGREPHLGIALLLFTFAAFVPCRVAQTWLAGIAVTAVPVIYGLSFAFVPEVSTFWAGRGGTSAQMAALAWNTTGTAILAVVSVAISRNLYSLRKTAFKAERLGNYLIERELGAGGMGQVFLARHALMCRPTAVKVVRSTNGEGLALQRFE